MILASEIISNTNTTFTTKHNAPSIGSNRIIATTCKRANKTENVKPSIAGTTLNVTHTMKRNMKIENNILIIIPPNISFLHYQNEVLLLIVPFLCILTLSTHIL